MYSEFIYVLRAGSYFKIGRSNDVTKRIAQLKIQLPFPVELFKVINTNDSVRLEQFLHKAYAHLRVNGEWFELTPADIATLVLYPCSIHCDRGSKLKNALANNREIVRALIEQEERNQQLERFIDEEADFTRNEVPANWGNASFTDYLAHECPYDDLPFSSFDEIEWIVVEDNDEE